MVQSKQPITRQLSKKITHAKEPIPSDLLNIISDSRNGMVKHFDKSFDLQRKKKPDIFSV